MNANRQDKFESNTLKMILVEKLSKFNAFDLMKAYNKMGWGFENWHEFSILLDGWNTQEVIKVVGHNSDGMTIYALR
jgi:hypothetical protein